MADSRMGRRNYKMSPDHLALPESKKVLKEQKDRVISQRPP